MEKTELNTRNTEFDKAPQKSLEIIYLDRVFIAVKVTT